MDCPDCDSSDTIPVWRDEEDHGEREPDYFGCIDCSRLFRPHLLNQADESFGQARLSDHEVRQLTTGNQHSKELTVVQWQAVKAVAVEKGVSDWTSKVDGTLTIDENIGLLERFATDGTGKTLREMKTPNYG